MLKTAIEASLEAGRAVLEIYARGFKVEYKADKSPLTEADLRAHSIIIRSLAQTGLPILSEESKSVPYAERAQWERFWLVDPIDGTKEFINKNGEFTINIALIEKGCPVLGVVYAPVLDTIYAGLRKDNQERCAWKAVGCAAKIVSEILASGERLSVSRSHLAAKNSLRVVASRSHCGEETRAFIDQLETNHGAVDCVSKGSSLKLCMVADGSADIYPRIAPTMEWDTAAAQAVVESAGGSVYEYRSDVPAKGYLTHGSAESLNYIASQCFTPLRYNKEDLLNPYFVVC
jgi:3'(2'), 5'-bisphosphate nucleotidase